MPARTDGTTTCVGSRHYYYCCTARVPVQTRTCRMFFSVNWFLDFHSSSTPNPKRLRREGGGIYFPCDRTEIIIVSFRITRCFGLAAIRRDPGCFIGFRPNKIWNYRFFFSRSSINYLIVYNLNAPYSWRRVNDIFDWFYGLDSTVIVRNTRSIIRGNRKF